MFLNYALMICQDYDITSSLRRGALHGDFGIYESCGFGKFTNAESIYSRSPPPYYVTHPPYVHDYDDDYQGEIQRDAQEGKLSIAMMLLARAIIQHYSTSTNNHLRTSSNTRNQAVSQDGRVDTQSKNVSYVGNASRNAGRTTGNQATNARNGFA
nr:hypothetical protein [Tanacetum cinerariifolium]